MKRNIIAMAFAGALVAGMAGMSHWGAALAGHGKAPARQIAVPATFRSLPPLASGDQYAEYIRALGRDVPEQEQAALAAWMSGPKPSHLLDSTWHCLFNEVMDALCQQHHPLPSRSDVFIGIVRGKTNDPTLRDYALQHLVDVLQPDDPGQPCELNPGKRQAIVTTMIEVARETRKELSGTAVQGLNLILVGRQRAEPSAQLPFTLEQLRPLAVNLALGEDVPNCARTTALQVCAQHGFDEILPVARRIAGDIKQPAILRLSAIAVIGQIGKAEDRPLLETLLAEHHPRLVKAVTPALKNLAARNNISLN